MEEIAKRISVLPVSEARGAREAESRPREVNRNLIFLVLALSIVFIACSLIYVWSHQQIIYLGYENSRATYEGQQLLQENKRLRVELAALKSPSRIERIALQELGLVNPKKEQLIIVR